MTLAVGQQLGPYEILAQIGAGGMGEVYKAHDGRLHRTVAIKVLPDAYVDDENRRLRFLREARAASALNHPNIVTLYDISNADGLEYLVMEYVAGTPLNRLIPAGGLPLSEVLQLAAQMTSALAAAHAAGVIHRDIKPANIMVTPDSQVKILDFGLAKLTDQAPEALDPATQTIDAPLTGSHVMMGTSGYMSPEQARGQKVDARSDLFALGAVIYEILAGRRAFPKPFDWTLPTMPPGAAKLSPLVLKLLASDPSVRYQSASDLAADLARIRQAMGSGAGTRRRWVWLAGAGAATAAGAVWIGRRSLAPTPLLSDGAHRSKVPEANNYYERSLLFGGSGPRHDPSQLRRMLERALELDPSFAAARAQYAFSHIILVLQGDSSDTEWIVKAEDGARRALRDDPACGLAYSILAGSHYLRGRKELMPVEVDRALKAGWEDPAVRMWLGLFHWWNGDYRQAKGEIDRMIARWPPFWPARLNLAEMLREQGDLAGAIRELERILEVDSQSRIVLASLSLVHMDSGNPTLARATLDRIPAPARANLRVKMHWARLLALEGDKQAAMREINDGLLAYGMATSFLWPLMLAECFALLGDEPKALEWLDRAIGRGEDREDWLRRDPHLASLRSTARFQQMLETVSFRRKHR